MLTKKNRETIRRTLFIGAAQWGKKFVEKISPERVYKSLTMDDGGKYTYYAAGLMGIPWYEVDDYVKIVEDHVENIRENEKLALEYIKTVIAEIQGRLDQGEKFKHN